MCVQGFKVGLCDRPPLNTPSSLLCLANNCCIADTFSTMLRRFDKLFNRNVFVHHYAQYMEVEDMAAAKTNVLGVMNAYSKLNHQPAPDVTEVYTPLGLDLSSW
jgi:tubulin epsilon